MKTPATRKGIADVVRESETTAEEAPTSPKTVLTLDSQSEDGRRKYAGKFGYKVPTMGDLVDISVLRARYLQQLTGIDDAGATLAEALAYLSITIDAESCPPWWKESNSGIDLYDYQPVLDLYAAARAYEATFLGRGTRDRRDEEAAAGEWGDDAAGGVGGDVPDTPPRRQVLATFGKRGGGAGDDGEGDGDDPEREPDDEGA